jgi:uncharacterized protein (DUF885 family)
MSMKTKISLIALSLSLLLSAEANASTTQVQQLETTTTAEAESLSESAKAEALFEAIFMENVMASPINQTYMGIKQDYDKWDEIGEEADAKQLSRTKAQLARLQILDASKLTGQDAISYLLLKQRLEQQIADFKWRYHNYPINQMYGMHSMLASMLINQHQITDIQDAKAYISRLEGIPGYFTQLERTLSIRADKGIVAPKFVFPYVISDSENIISGAPFAAQAKEKDGSKDSALWADFKGKIEALNLPKVEHDALLSRASTALKTQVAPAYQRLIAFIKELETKADDRAGVWKFPEGEAFYNNALARTTTTDMSAEQIHSLGLQEVERIHNEMRAIMAKVKFEGTLQEFFAFLRDDDQFYFPNDDAGRTAYLTKTKQLIATMSSRLDEVFKLKPKADLIVKQVEAFREKSAGKAFYEQPAPDGSRPGSYYANLYDMKAMPKYQMEALAYHEGLPGHHMQIAIAQELEGIPKFRKFGGYTAYIEGWGLYTEYLPKEMGLYADPYSDFGRLAMELWRACRLVVDTGIHAKRWTREQAIAYYVDNTPNAESDSIKMVERHIIMPSQATAYKIGMIKLLELRSKAQQALGNKFDIRTFHNLVLKNGPLPLDVLAAQIDDWIANQG